MPIHLPITLKTVQNLETNSLYSASQLFDYDHSTTGTVKPTNNWHLIFYFISLTTLFKDIFRMAEWQSCKIHTRLENHADQHYLGHMTLSGTKTKIY